MKVAFDIGGVLSKYPDELREIARCLQAGGAEVFVLTDMHVRADVLQTLALNGFDFIPDDHVFSADYATHGEGCKAEILREQGIDLFLDDFMGYVAEPGCPIRLLVMPDSTKPYYHPTWKTTGAEGDFGRRTYRKTTT